MNKERLLKVAEIVEDSQHKFNGITALFYIGTWFDSVAHFDSKSHFLNSVMGDVDDYPRPDIKDPFACNTTACIAGFACLLFDYEAATQGKMLKGPKGQYYNTEVRGAEILGLDHTERSELFVGAPDGSITGPEAAMVIRHFVETGKVEWGIIERFSHLSEA